VDICVCVRLHDKHVKQLHGSDLLKVCVCVCVDVWMCIHTYACLCVCVLQQIAERKARVAAEKAKVSRTDTHVVCIHVCA
jgi:hypothetical protein